MSHPLAIAALQARYAAQPSAAEETLSSIFSQIEARGADATWIHVAQREPALAAAAQSVAARLPLAGIPFAIKDNIDLAVAPTTAACPDFLYTPAVSAFIVQKLCAAGAVPIGKTNLDQFATGLTGTRSPYGVPVNPFNSEYIPGGSSSGSAVAVANGLCSFALGTDTAGSGRVPAAFNGLVGLKPTRGLLSIRGVVPACRSLDCVSIFTRTCADAAQILRTVANYDELDPFSRPAAPPTSASWPPKIGVPREDQLEFFENRDAAALFEKAIAHWRELGAAIVEIDFEPFLQAAHLLYEGAWVAERYLPVRALLEKSPNSFHPVSRQILEGGRRFSAIDAFQSNHRLAELKRKSERVWNEIDALLTPTVGTAYRVAEVLADPIRLNSHLGYYTNYVNLLDLCALALPAGKLSSGVPWGVTLQAPAFHDDRLLVWGARFCGEATPAPTLAHMTAASIRSVQVVVCGAHLSGLPLNGQLLERGGRLIRATHTASEYRLFELPGTVPPKPGLVRVATGGVRIAVEVWEIPLETYGSFVAGIPEPLGIGKIHFEDGESVQGFLCETIALEGARDVSEFGGWRAFLANRQR